MNRLHDWAIRNNITPQAWAELQALFLPGFESLPGGSEAMLQAELRVLAPRFGGSLWRNNSGAMVDETSRLIRFGLANDSAKFNAVFKSSDLIGITPINWHGRIFGVFTAVEVKKPGWKFTGTEREIAQRNFLTDVERMGGIATFATSSQDYTSRCV